MFNGRTVKQDLVYIIPHVQTLRRLDQYRLFPRLDYQPIENAMLGTPNLLLQIGRMCKVLALAAYSRLSRVYVCHPACSK